MMKKTTARSLLAAASLTLLSCLALSACGVKRTPLHKSEDFEGRGYSTMKIRTQDTSGAMDETLEEGGSGPFDAQPGFWEVREFEAWMEQQRSHNQELADGRDRSFFDRDDHGNYVCREWTQEDVDSLYESWQEQLDMMKAGYHFTKSMSLPDGGVLAGAVDPETWDQKPIPALGATMISLPDGSTVDLGHFDTLEAASKAVRDYLEEQVSAGKMTQAEADGLLKQSSAA